MKLFKKYFLFIIALGLILISALNVSLTKNDLVYRPTDNFVFFAVIFIITLVVTVLGVLFRKFAGRLSKVSVCFLPLITIILNFTSEVSFDYAVEYTNPDTFYSKAILFITFAASLVLFFTNVKRVWAIIVQGVFIMIVNLIFLMGFVLALMLDNFGAIEIVDSYYSHDNEYIVRIIEHDAGALGFDRVKKLYDNKPNINLLLGGIYDDAVVTSAED